MQFFSFGTFSLEFENHQTKCICNAMGDSDDEFDRRRSRDKFTRERHEHASITASATS
jgi:hypothetical protein